MNATAHLFHADEWTHVFVCNDAFFFFVTRLGATITHSQILQLAFTTLIADGAIEWMVDEQKLHHRFLCFDGFVRLGANNHALRNRCRTRRHGLWHFLDIHQAHAATGGNAQFLVIAKMGDVGPRLLSRVHDHAAFSSLHFFAVKFNFDHFVYA